MTNTEGKTAGANPAAPKAVWEKPVIVEFKPVTVARGISFNAGDGIANLS